MTAEIKQTAPNTHRGQIPAKPAPALSGRIPGPPVATLTDAELTTLVRLAYAATQVHAQSSSGVLFEGYDGAEPQRTQACAALDELEHATDAAIAALKAIGDRAARQIHHL
jgi:hypothetical protein